MLPTPMWPKCAPISFVWTTSPPNIWTTISPRMRDKGVPFMAKESVSLKTALFVRLEAKPGKESQVEQFLRDGFPLVEQEPGPVAWFGIRLGPSTFGIFDAFQ